MQEVHRQSMGQRVKIIKKYHKVHRQSMGQRVKIIKKYHNQNTKLK